MDKGCIVTGGSGFIGTHLLAALVEEKRYERVYVLDLREPSIKHESIEYVACDIRRPIDVRLEAPCQVCYHLAALCKEPGYAPGEYLEANHVGSLNVLDLCSRTGARNVVFTSTMMVFRAGERRMSEDSPTEPDTWYGRSKLLAEQAHIKWLRAGSGRRLRIVRPAVVFGKGENGNFTRLYRALRSGRFAYIGRKDTIKSSVYVKDLVRFLVFLADDSGKRTMYNMAFPEPTTIRQICEAFFRVFGFRRKLPVVPFQLALLASYAFEALRRIGLLRTGIHHRRIEKLYRSTNISADTVLMTGFEFAYSLRSALEDWKTDCAPGDLY